MKSVTRFPIWLQVVLLALFLVACQGNALTVPPSPSETPVPFTLPPTWTSTATYPPTPAPDWFIPPLTAPSAASDVVIYTTSRSGYRGTDVYFLPLDAHGNPMGEKQLWWHSDDAIAGLQLSPDGKHLAVWLQDERGDDGFFFDPFAGLAGPRPLPFWHADVWEDVPGNLYKYLGWASDSSGLLFAIDKSIALLGPDERLLVEKPIDGYTVSGAALSPDGRYLIYSLDGKRKDSDYDTETWRLDLQTQSIENIWQFPSPNLVWSPNGDWVAYADNSARIMRPDGSEQQGASSENVAAPLKWSPSGDGVAFTHVFNMYRYYTVGITDVGESGEVKVYGRLLSDKMKMMQFDPCWLPDGKSLLVVGGDHQDADIWLVSRDGERVRQLTFDGGPKRSPVWLPLP